MRERDRLIERRRQKEGNYEYWWNTKSNNMREREVERSAVYIHLGLSLLISFSHTHHT